MLILMHTKGCQTRARAPSEQADLMELLLSVVGLKSAQALVMIVGVVLQHRARIVYTARACSDRWELVASEAETSWKSYR